jgi:acetyltransferase-like isoleucine patch superfamily enzyme
MIILFKIIKKIIRFFEVIYCTNKVKLLFYFNGIKYNSIKSYGIPIVDISKNAKCMIGNNFFMNNGHKFNPIGRNSPCYIIAYYNGNLKIGNNVSMSSCAINCHNAITIEDNVKIGGGVCIYDTDFHSLNSLHRMNSKLDHENTKTAEVTIKRNAFIGAHSIILKGVTIGENSVIGAGSVVTKSIPSNEIWAGNPAKFIKEII